MTSSKSRKTTNEIAYIQGRANKLREQAEACENTAQYLDKVQNAQGDLGISSDYLRREATRKRALAEQMDRLADTDIPVVGRGHIIKR